MQEEIKEILDKFDKVLKNYELDKKFGQISVDSICHLFPNEMIAIKDYITNLQEENEKLKLAKDTKCASEILCECLHNDYKSRNEKAIELIKDEGLYEEDTNTFCGEIYSSLPELLNILQGVDKE